MILTVITKDYNNPDNVTLAVKALDLYKLETGKGQNNRSSNRGRPKKKQEGSAADTKVADVYESPSIMQPVYTVD